ncbi:MAG: M23 family metallopeptidase [Acidobacteriota bacterium]|nr:M23 family metallopeptidase [Acidobacteriota bacterium]
MRTLFIIFLNILSALSLICQTSAPVAIHSTPKQILIERTKNGQELNFDFLLENKTDANWELTKIRLTVYDTGGNLIAQKSAWSGLEATLPSSFIVEAKRTKLLLNPFNLFNSAIELNRLKYEFFFSETVEENAKSFTTETTVSPVFYQPKTNLILPVGERVLVYEGHDFYAHHRRVDLTNQVVARLGVTTNPTRYGYDFMPVNERGESFRNDGKTNEDWLGFGASILAPAGGVVKEMRNTVDDNILGKKMFDFRLVFEDIKAFYGNYIIIDHQNGEYSLLLHLKKGSVAVKVGDKIKQGQPIAQMGISGDADYVHLHYQLQNATEINNESLPSYFSNFRWRHGKTFSLVKTGALETGDIVENVFGK